MGSSSGAAKGGGGPAWVRDIAKQHGLKPYAEHSPEAKVQIDAAQREMDAFQAATQRMEDEARAEYSSAPKYGTPAYTAWHAQNGARLQAAWNTMLARQEHDHPERARLRARLRAAESINFHLAHG